MVNALKVSQYFQNLKGICRRDQGALVSIPWVSRVTFLSYCSMGLGCMGLIGKHGSTSDKDLSIATDFVQTELDVILPKPLNFWSDRVFASVCGFSLSTFREESASAALGYFSVYMDLISKAPRVSFLTYVSSSMGIITRCTLMWILYLERNEDQRMLVKKITDFLYRVAAPRLRKNDWVKFPFRELCYRLCRAMYHLFNGGKGVIRELDRGLALAREGSDIFILAMILETLACSVPETDSASQYRSEALAIYQEAGYKRCHQDLEMKTINVKK